MKKILMAVLVCVAGVFLGASPAGAHPGGDTPSTNYKTELSPAPDGFEIRLIDEGERFELLATGDRTIVVTGYDEPLYRVGPDGAFENENAEYTKSVNDGTTDLGVGKPEIFIEPEWKRTSTEPVVRWRDMRAFFNESMRPSVDPQKTDAPTEWTIPATVDGVTTNVSGVVRYIEGPDATLKYMAIVAVAIALVALGLTKIWKKSLIASLSALVAVDIVHSVLIAARKEEVGGAFTSFLSGIYVVAGWAMALLAIYLLRKRTSQYEEPMFFAIFAAIVMGFFAGFADIADLSRSQIAAAGPLELTRWSVALSCGLGVGIFASCLLRLMRAKEDSQAPRSNPIPTNV